MLRKILLPILTIVLGSAALGQVNVKSSGFAVNQKAVPIKFIFKIEFDQDLKLAPGGNGNPLCRAISFIIKDASGVTTQILAGPSDFVAQTGNNKILLFSPATPLPAALLTASTFELEMTQLQFTIGGTDTAVDIRVSGSVVDSTSYKKGALKAQKDAFDKAKPTADKNFFAGFDFTSPDKGSTQGDGNLIINVPIKLPDPHFFVNLDLKKSSSTDADPKQFDLGIAYRRAFLMPGITRALKQAYASANDDTIVKAHKNIQEKQYLLGFLTDFSGRIEGEAMNFNTTNAVFDLMPFQLISRVKQIGSKNLFLKFQVLPAGFELGRNLRTENDAVKHYYISRFKFGGELGLVYEPTKKDSAFIKRAELTVNSVNRYLFRDETAFDPTTDKASGISKGFKTFYNADFKVFFADAPKGRVGIKISRIHGPLPPTFNDTSAFTYGIIFESTEDSKP